MSLRAAEGGEAISSSMNKSICDACEEIASAATAASQ